MTVNELIAELQEATRGNPAMGDAIVWAHIDGMGPEPILKNCGVQFKPIRDWEQGGRIVYICILNQNQHM